MRVPRSPRQVLRVALLAAASAIAMPAIAQPRDLRPHGDKPALATASRPIASHRGFRATRLLDATVFGRRGQQLGTLEDVVVDMCDGEVRHAVLALDDSARSVAAPISSIGSAPPVETFEGGVERLKLDLDGRTVASLPAAAPRPDAAPSAGCPQRTTARWLLGRNLLDIDGKDIGKVADLVISMNRARVNFAVVDFDPSPGPPGSLLAFPIQLFRLRGDGSLVLPMTTAYLKTLKGFLATGWSHMLSPDELADLDRQFTADFPAIWDRSPRTLFEHLDRDQSGALSPAEAAMSDRVRGHFAAMDQDGDGHLSKPEFVLNYPRTASR